jgi:cysteine-rich repeat protein
MAKRWSHSVLCIAAALFGATGCAEDTGDETTVGVGGGGTGGGVTTGCGDGVVDPEEQCDDGNDRSSDGCNADCTLSGRVLWRTSTSLSPQRDYGLDVAELTDGRVAVAGYAVMTYLGAAWLVLSADGQVLDSSVVGGNSADRRASAVVALPDGGFVTSGSLHIAPDDYLWMDRFDAAGTLVWRRDGDQMPKVGEGQVGMATDGDTLFVVTSGHTEEGQPVSGWLASFDLAGQQQSLVPYPESSLVDVAASSTQVAAAGTTETGSALIVVTGHDGTELWSDQFGASSVAYTVGIDDSGGVVLAGGSYSGGFVRRYAATGDLVWHVDRGEADYYVLMALAADGSSAWSVSASGRPDSQELVRADVDGQVLFSQPWPLDGEHPVQVSALSINSSGELLLTGSRPAGSYRDIDVAKLSP